MYMPKFSIVVPVYNVESYLVRCIESVLLQTYADFELVLVDDGSSDESGNICDSYAEKDCRIKVIHKSNGGVSTARNVGIENASGEYITFCDSDDYYKPNLLETVIKYIDDGDVDLLSYNYETLLLSGQKNGSQVDTGEFIADSPIKVLSLIIEHTFTSYLGWSMCTSFFRKKIIDTYHLRVCTTCNNYAEDIGFGIKFLFHANKVVGISDSLYVYDKTREESMMHQSNGVFKCNDVNEVANDVWLEFKRAFNKDFDAYFSIIFFQLMYTEYAEMIWHHQIEDLPNEIKKIQRKDWYFFQTNKVLRSKKLFLNFYSRSHVGELMAINRYCLHGSYMRYHIECWINHLLNKNK